MTKIKSWLIQTSTRTALAALFADAAGYLSGHLDWSAALTAALPVAYGLVVNDSKETAP